VDINPVFQRDECCLITVFHRDFDASVADGRLGRQSVGQRRKPSPVQQPLICGDETELVVPSRGSKQTIGGIGMGDPNVARGQHDFVSQGRFMERQFAAYVREPLLEWHVQRDSPAFDKKK
jgi:hypothetical protein